MDEVYMAMDEVYMAYGWSIRYMLNKGYKSVEKAFISVTQRGVQNTTLACHTWQEALSKPSPLTRPM